MATACQEPIRKSDGLIPNCDLAYIHPSIGSGITVSYAHLAGRATARGRSFPGRAPKVGADSFPYRQDVPRVRRPHRRQEWFNGSELRMPIIADGLYAARDLRR